MKKLLIILFLILISKNAYASRIFIDDNIKILPSKHDFAVNLLLDTEGVSINAIKTQISYPDNLLELTKVSQNDSVVSVWVEPITKNGNTVSFSGIIFNGTSDVIDPITNEKKSSKLLQLHFKPKGIIGNGIINIFDSVIYKNDGLGIPTKISDEYFAFELSDTVGYESEIEDTTPPEDFTAVVKSLEDVYDGKYVVIFSAKDLGSGIDYYEVKEGEGEWQRGESPYLLKDQILRSKIQVKAVDYAGNIRIVEIAGSGYYIYLYILIIILIILFIIYRIRSVIKKQLKKYQ